MNITRFLDSYTMELFGNVGDHKFETLRVLSNGLSAVKTAKILNFAAKCMECEEYYCEIGTWTGYTLASAGSEIASRVIGIDNFKPNWRTNIKLTADFINRSLSQFWGLNFKFIDNDFRNVTDLDKNKMAVLYIDGDHDYKNVWDALEWSKEFLNDKALILLDDVRIDGVTEAMRDWVSKNKEYEEIFYCKTSHIEQHGKINDPFLQAGLAILKYERLT